jgi:hypothetical protein
MRWTEIEHRWYAIDMNLGGILHDFHRIQTNDNDTKEEVDQLPPSDNLHGNLDNATYSLIHEPATTSIPLTTRFSELNGFSEINGFTVLRNGTKIAKPQRG